MNHNNFDENLQRWAALIEDAVASGLTREKWCEEHGISKWTYYYWNRKIKNLTGGNDSAVTRTTGRCCTTMQPETDPVFYELPVSVTDVQPEIIGAGTGHADSASLILEYGQFRLTIPQGVDAGSLQTVVRVMRNA